MKGEFSSKEAGSPFQSAVFLLCPGFEGSVCGHNVDDCPNHNCQNGGICVDGVNTYNCRCPPQWTGMYYGKQMENSWPSPNVQLELHTAERNSHLCLVLQSRGQMSVEPLKENCLHQSHHNGGQFPIAPGSITGLCVHGFGRQVPWFLSRNAVQLSELHFCLYGLLCKRICVFQKYKTWPCCYRCVHIAVLCWYVWGYF